MISVTSGELNAWLAAFFFPLARILPFIVSAPPFNNSLLRTRFRLVLGLAITFAVAPVIAPPTAVEGAAAVLLILVQQMLIGFGMGLSMRLVFTAIDMAGNMISMQMGLGFATAYAPESASQTGVISEMIGMLALLSFLALNGHLLGFSVLVESFSALPIGVFPSKVSWLNLASWGGIIFSFGMMIALPILCVLLITNMALGILGCVSPQLNLMAIGFPITITLGFGSLYVSFLYLGPRLQQMFEAGLHAMLDNFVLK